VFCTEALDDITGDDLGLEQEIEAPTTDREAWGARRVSLKSHDVDDVLTVEHFGHEEVLTSRALDGVRVVTQVNV
jgi:hypothetical protein